MDESEWSDIKPEFPKSFGGRPYGCDRCPGWAIRQPEVNEAASAYAAYQKGAIAVYFPDPRNDLLDAVQILEGAFNRYEAEQMRELKAKS